MQRASRWREDSIRDLRALGKAREAALHAEPPASQSTASSPKALAPKPPIHPWCRCRLRSTPHLRAADAREREGAERAFLREMGLREGARAMGGRSRLQRVLNGESALAAWNRGQAPAYQVRTLGRVVPATRVTELDALIERAAPGVTYANVTGFPFAREAVERVTGESLEGYRVSISNHAMVHALKTHGSASERLRGQAPITREDLRIVPRIFRSSQVTDGGLTKQGRRAVRFSHQHGDFEFTASAELRTGRRELALITMWKRPR